MLSRPDYMEKQIIIVTADKRKNLSLRNDNILVKQNDKIINQISCYKVFCVFVVGDVTISTKLINRLLKYQISIYCFDLALRPKCIIGNQLEWNYLLRSQQYIQDTHRDLQLARHIIANKIANQYDLLKSLREKSSQLQHDLLRLNKLYESVMGVNDAASLRGIEWNAAKLFFQHYFGEIGRRRREPRTRSDSINFLLDMGYSYLYGLIESHLSLYGFDLYKWVYHTLFYERKSLVCDLVEPFRCIIDKAIRKMYNLGQVRQQDFVFVKGEYTLEWEKRKEYSWLLLRALLEYKEEVFVYVRQYYAHWMTHWKKDFPKFYIARDS